MSEAEWGSEWSAGDQPPLWGSVPDPFALHQHSPLHSIIASLSDDTVLPAPGRLLPAPTAANSVPATSLFASTQLVASAPGFLTELVQSDQQSVFGRSASFEPSSLDFGGSSRSAGQNYSPFEPPLSLLQQHPQQPPYSHPQQHLYSPQQPLHPQFQSQQPQQLFNVASAVEFVPSAPRPTAATLLQTVPLTALTAAAPHVPTAFEPEPLLPMAEVFSVEQLEHVCGLLAHFSEQNFEELFAQDDETIAAMLDGIFHGDAAAPVLESPASPEPIPVARSPISAKPPPPGFPPKQPQPQPQPSSTASAAAPKQSATFQYKADVPSFTPSGSSKRSAARTSESRDDFPALSPSSSSRSLSELRIRHGSSASPGVSASPSPASLTSEKALSAWPKPSVQPPTQPAALPSPLSSPAPSSTSPPTTSSSQSSSAVQAPSASASTRGKPASTAPNQRQWQEVQGGFMTLKSAERESPRKPGSKDPQETIVCKYFLQGSCLRADCMFAHDTKSVACKFWLNGYCRNEDDCDFAHDPATFGSARADLNLEGASPDAKPATVPMEVLTLDQVGYLRAAFESSQLQLVLADADEFLREQTEILEGLESLALGGTEDAPATFDLQTANFPQLHDDPTRGMAPVDPGFALRPAPIQSRPLLSSGPVPVLESDQDFPSLKMAAKHAQAFEKQARKGRASKPHSLSESSATAPSKSFDNLTTRLAALSMAEQLRLSQLHNSFPDLPPQVVAQAFLDLHCSSDITITSLKDRYPTTTYVRSQVTFKDPRTAPGHIAEAEPPGRVRRGPAAQILWSDTGAAVGGLYAKNRQVAIQCAQQRNSLFQQAAQAFMHGNRQLAKELSFRARQYDLKMKNLHATASTEIFQARNQGLKDNLIDLHGLHVEEALPQLADRIVKSRAAGERQLLVIVGTGHHSKHGHLAANQQERLRPAVIQYLTSNRLRSSMFRELIQAGAVQGLHVPFLVLFIRCRFEDASTDKLAGLLRVMF
eukprot:m.863246 g.863246  ORF g.863246 m.863246 type:complete len:992 (-) comp59698_c1_seq5:112-3087(-)